MATTLSNLMASTKAKFQPVDETSAAGMSQAEAIQYHYDNDTRFFSLWLDETLSYSSARWSNPLTGEVLAETLDGAQREKIRYHLAAAGVAPGSRVIDVGCGWGAVVRSAVADFGAARALGLTLSTHQLDHIQAHKWPGVETLLQDVYEYETTDTFDAAVSIGAFEHFAKPEMDREQKVAVYRAFFEKLGGMMPRGSRFSLQTIVWDNVGFEEGKTVLPTTVFPQSDLPFIDEIAESANGTFRLVYLENDGNQYARTLAAWIEGLRAQRAQVIEEWDEAKYEWFLDYLRHSRLSFQKRVTSLARLVLVRR